MKFMGIIVLACISIISMGTPASAGTDYNVAIIESTNWEMDDEWNSVVTSAGYNPTSFTIADLDDLANFDGYQILIVSDGTDDYTTQQIQTVQDFLEIQGPVYLQTEYTTSYDTCVGFESIVSALGGSFSFGSTVSGSLTPMVILGDMATNPNSVASLPTFHYGLNGAGDATIEPFLEYNSNHFGFIFSSPENAVGKMITTSDQDWVRSASTTVACEHLMANMLNALAENVATPTDPSSLGAVKALYR